MDIVLDIDVVSIKIYNVTSKTLISLAEREEGGACHRMTEWGRGSLEREGLID